MKSVYSDFDDSKATESVAGSDLNPFNAPDSLLENQIPSLNIRRYPKKKIKLEHGHILSLDYPVPSAIQNAVQREFRESKELGEEFSQLRYTAAVCDPDDFVPRRGYNLHPAMYNRHTELLIAMTYRDENKVLTSRTLHAVMQNIRDICHARSEFWSQGGPAWQKIVCTVVMDGIDPSDSGTLDTLATIGVFQEDIMKKAVNGKETVAHIFEYTTQLSVTENQELVQPQNDDPMSFPPIQMILCIKQRSTSKVNSHRWIFNGFCRILNPEVVVLLDTGTKPQRKSLLALWQSFYNDKNLGAAYGEVTSSINGNSDYLNPYVAAQTFEYEKANVLEKPLESSLGYVTGGLFSAYRYRAVMGRPLEQYFNGDQTLAKKLGKNGLEGMNILKKNMFFACDRILAFETLAKRGSKWRLSFVKAAKCEVQVPKNLVELMAQRRQDFNGAFAASIYTAIHVGQIYKSDHGPIQLLLFHLQLLYSLAHFILSWFSLASFWIITQTVMLLVGTASVSNDEKAWPFGNEGSPILNNFLLHFSTAFLGLQFILSLGNRPKGSRMAYTLTVMVFSVIQIYIVVLVVYLLVMYTSGSSVHLILDEETIKTAHWGILGADIALTALVGTYGAHLIASIFQFRLWRLITTWWADLIGMSCIANILMVYAFCNWHDVILRVPVTENAAALPQATSQKDEKHKFIEEVDRLQLEIDTQFSKAVQRALKPAEMEGDGWEPMSLEDSYKSFRTYLVLLWVFSNILLVIYISATGTNRFCFTDIPITRLWNYTVATMWSIVGLSLFRFVGSMWFLVKTGALSCFRKR
ncbi:uncharacterized protein N7483_010998 [Penicillium malachiteum]|uniref:uncharacterized protein n=1 Tax=Penicillium malachiteum TaxID=1324776 RepID=UPI002549259A|nr:uncharacterized protein N7483_010998 [Penicillium malachiteum]KAJ5713817.1 hypothetical protein N7483_010998 [Penicillium malachiteum]